MESFLERCQYLSFAECEIVTILFHKLEPFTPAAKSATLVDISELCGLSTNLTEYFLNNLVELQILDIARKAYYFKN